MMRITRKGVLGTAISSTIVYFSYHEWKRRELIEIQKLSATFLNDGVVILDIPIPVERKRMSFNVFLKPALLQHFKKTVIGFNENDPSTWPMPVNGKSYSMSLHDQLKGMPELVSSSYLTQAILCWICDPQLQFIHFGSKQTHFRLKLLISPFWALFGDYFKPKHMYSLQGADQSWHLVNPPNPKYGRVGKPVPWGAHVDGGEHNIYFRLGLPPIANPTISYIFHQSWNNKLGKWYISNVEEKVTPLTSPEQNIHQISVDEQLLLLMFHQLAILFYCETPGDVTPVTGATGFFPHSNRALLEGLRVTLSGTSSGTSGINDTGTSSGSSSNVADMNDNEIKTDTPALFKRIPWKVHTSAIREWGEIHTGSLAIPSDVHLLPPTSSLIAVSPPPLSPLSSGTTAKVEVSTTLKASENIASITNKTTYSASNTTIPSTDASSTNTSNLPQLASLSQPPLLPLQQITILEDKMLLIMGLTAHTTMFAIEPMINNQFRSLQNCRILYDLKQTDIAKNVENKKNKNSSEKNHPSYETDRYRDEKMLQMIRQLPIDSPLRKLVRAPLEYLIVDDNSSDNKNKIVTQVLTDVSGSNSLMNTSTSDTTAVMNSAIIYQSLLSKYDKEYK